MAKLSKKKFSELSEKATRYRWEFLRRNPIYGRELVALKEKGKKLIPLLKSPKSTSEDFKLAEMAFTDFANCWGLVSLGLFKYFPSPEKEFNQLTLSEKKMLLPYTTEPKIDVVSTFAKLIMESKKPNPGLYSTLTLKINLDMPQRRIEQEVKRTVQIMKAARKKLGLKDISKPHYKWYKNYLKIYDLREKKKMTYKSIHKKLYKGVDDNEITREHESTIAKEYKSARELVDFKYRNIW